MVDFLSPVERSQLMAKVRGRDTGPEMRVRKLLHKLGYRFRLHDKQLPGRPDIVFSKRKSVVFVNGCFWHGHSCQKRDVDTLPPFWKEKITKNIRRDIQVSEELYRLGWSVMVVWECDIKISRLEKTEKELAFFLGPVRFEK